MQWIQINAITNNFQNTKKLVVLIISISVLNFGKLFLLWNAKYFFDKELLISNFDTAK